MDLNHINRKHQLEVDFYYKFEYGISSKLIQFENGIFRLEVLLTRNTCKDYSSIAAEVANLWQSSRKELKHAIGCKVFIIDAYKFPFKQEWLKCNILPEYDSRKGIIFYRQHLN